MAVRPRLADVRCTRLRFEPGDRGLVRVYRKLDGDARKRLRRTVQKWAGADVEVLIYDVTEMDITVEKGKGGLVI